MKLLVTLLVAVAFADAKLLPSFSENVKQASDFNGTIWAVIVAGSNGYYNYRHQADAYHAYQIVHSHGVKDENIIIFHYDDIASDPSNPTPGIVINKPNGPDVYHNVPKDYTGEDVTPENFLAALKGDSALEAKGKKVLKSGPNDHVFIYFTDHGAPGLIAFPVTYLYAKDLIPALQYLHDNQRYSKLVFYIEACESGSMFDQLLPTNINIYATTAANPDESSYAYYWDDKRQTYLGDEYSIHWLEDSDKKSLNQESLEKQFETVKDETKLSHVQQYGDLKLDTLSLSEFLGAKTSSNVFVEPISEIPPIHEAVDSGDVPLKIAEKKWLAAKTTHERSTLAEAYYSLLRGRDFLTRHINEIIRNISVVGTVPAHKLLHQKQPVRDHECYTKLVDAFNRTCFNIAKHTYALRHLYKFVNFCQQQHPQVLSEETITHAAFRMEGYCARNHLSDNADFQFSKIL